MTQCREMVWLKLRSVGCWWATWCCRFVRSLYWGLAQPQKCLFPRQDVQTDCWKFDLSLQAFHLLAMCPLCPLCPVRCWQWMRTILWAFWRCCFSDFCCCIDALAVLSFLQHGVTEPVSLVFQTPKYMMKVPLCCWCGVMAFISFWSIPIHKCVCMSMCPQSVYSYRCRHTMCKV